MRRFHLCLLEPGSMFLPSRLHDIRRARNLRRYQPSHYDAPQPKGWWRHPVVPHDPALDVRPYLAPAPAKPGPLLRLHDLLAQLDRAHASTTPVRITRTRATDVVPLPKGVRGRWEGWSASVWTDADDLTAQILRVEMLELVMQHVRAHSPTQPRKDRRPVLAHERAASLALRLLSQKEAEDWKLTPRPAPRKEARVCVCGCGRVIPATARADKLTFNQVCRNRLSKQRAA